MRTITPVKKKQATFLLTDKFVSFPAGQTSLESVLHPISLYFTMQETDRRRHEPSTRFKCKNKVPFRLDRELSSNHARDSFLNPLRRDIMENRFAIRPQRRGKKRYDLCRREIINVYGPRRNQMPPIIIGTGEKSFVKVEKIKKKTRRTKSGIFRRKSRREKIRKSFQRK